MKKYFTVDAFFSYFINDEFVKDVYIECVTKDHIKGYFPVESPKINIKGHNLYLTTEA